MMGRASVIPELPKERLVLIRDSFLNLCDGNHCAAALLNNFVYWHDWCVDRERQDASAQTADPTHHNAEPGYWFWKSNEDLEKDLMHMWTAKTIRAGTKVLLDKQLIQERANRLNPFDRTKQFRLMQERLSAAIQQLDSPGTRALEPLSRSGSFTACTKQKTFPAPSKASRLGATGGNAAVSMRENYRMETGSLPHGDGKFTISSYRDYKYREYRVFLLLAVLQGEEEEDAHSSPAHQLTRSPAAYRSLRGHRRRESSGLLGRPPLSRNGLKNG